MLYQVAEDLRAFKSTLWNKTEKKGSKLSNKDFPKRDQTEIVMKKVNSMGFVYHNFKSCTTNTPISQQVILCSFYNHSAAELQPTTF